MQNFGHSKNSLPTPTHVLSRRNYRGAKDLLEQALARVESSPFIDDARMGRMKSELSAALSDKELEYGLGGFVRSGDRWFSPKDYEQKFVHYRGRRHYFEDLRPILIINSEPAVRQHIGSLQPGSIAHKKLVRVQDIKLTENSSTGAVFQIVYDWELWTLNGIRTGRLGLDMAYSTKRDQWQILGMGQLPKPADR
jgi:hypothetical protein